MSSTNDVINFSTTFLLNIRPFIYYSLYIILLILFTVSLVTSNVFAFYIFYISLLISTFISNLYTVVVQDTNNINNGITFYDSYLLFFNFKKNVNYFLPLFVFMYTISYLFYTSIIVQKITPSQIYILLFLLFYFICNLSYMLIIKNTLFKSNKFTVIWYIFSGLILGFFFAYFIDHYINYQLLFFSTYKTRNTQLRCKNI